MKNKMSKLEELINKYCPDGVEYVSLGEIATDIFRGSGIKREQVTSEGIPCVRYGEIYTTYNVWFEECISHTELSKIDSPKFFEYGDILFAITGEKVEEIAKSCAYVGHDKCLAGGDIVVLKHKQNPKYLSYALSTEFAQKQKSKGKVKSKVVHSSVPAIKEIIIPVPPLPVQEEIVKILDKFTELEAELEAELVMRKQQYEYYRDKMLSLEDYEGEIAEQPVSVFVNKVFSGNNKKRLVEGNYNVYGSTGIISKTNTPVYHKRQILIARVGANAGYVQIADGDYDVSDNTLIVDVGDNIDFLYLYYVLFNIKLNKFAKGGGQPLVTASEIKDIIIKVPKDIIKQKRMAEILNKFTILTEDISEGLPAEIKMRHQQYEYYRDKLLSFKEMND